MSKSPTWVNNTGSNNIRVKSEKWLKKASTHIFLCEVNQVLKVNVISVSSNVVIDEKVKLILYPVLENKGQNSCSQLQKEDDTQEHWELRYKNINYFTMNVTYACKSDFKKSLKQATYKLKKKWVLPERSNAASKTEDEHYSPDHKKEPHWVKTSHVCDRRDVGENALVMKNRNSWANIIYLLLAIILVRLDGNTFNQKI